MDLDLDKLGRSPFVAGALGSLVALKFAPGASWPERAFNVLCGSLCAGFGAPALAEWLHLQSPGMNSGLSFAVGMFGLSLAAAVTDGIKQTKLGEIITSWFPRRG